MLALAMLAASLLSVIAQSHQAVAAAPYTVASTVSRGYSGPNVGINSYGLDNLGAFSAVGTAGENVPAWCIQGHLGHSTGADAYSVAGSNIVTSGQLDYLLWRYGGQSFDQLDATASPHDTAAAINGLSLFYANSPRSSIALPVWANVLTGESITPADSSGHAWNALPDFSLSYPIGMYSTGSADYDAAEVRTYELYLEAEQYAAPWSLDVTATDTVQLTSATGAPIAGHPVTLHNAANEVVGTATTDATGTVVVTTADATHVRADAPGVHDELDAGQDRQRLVVAGAPARLLAGVHPNYTPIVVTQISNQAAMPGEVISDAVVVSGLPLDGTVDVDLELYDLDVDPDGTGDPLTSVTVTVGNGTTSGLAPYTVGYDQQGHRLGYRERWIKPTGETGPWSPLGIATETTTVRTIEIGTQVLNQYVPVDGVVIDRVTYSADIDPDAGEWTMRATVVARSNGEATDVIVTVPAQLDPAGGFVDVEIELNQRLAGGGYVMYEELLLDGEVVASHRDPNDPPQWFTVIDLGTEVQNQLIPAEGGQLVDRVWYPAGADPEAGEWTLRGVAVHRATGEHTDVTATVVVTPDPAGGHFDLGLDIPAELATGDYVMYEYLELDGEPVGSHEDPTDEQQWFTKEPPAPPTTTPRPPAPTVPPAGNLPTTGISIGAIVVMASLILVAGLAAVAVVRFRSGRSAVESEPTVSGTR